MGTFPAPIAVSAGWQGGRKSPRLLLPKPGPYPLDRPLHVHVHGDSILNLDVHEPVDENGDNVSNVVDVDRRLEVDSRRFVPFLYSKCRLREARGD